MGKLKDIVTKEVLEDLYIKQGKTYKEIAIIFNCSKRAINYWIIKFGIRAQKWKLTDIVTKKLLEDLHIKQKKTPTEIGKILGCSTWCIYRCMKKFNIQIIRSGLSRCDSWQPWEEDFLKLTYPDHTNIRKNIRLCLSNRTFKSIKNRALKLGATRRYRNFDTSIAEIPEMLALWDFDKNWDETKSHSMYVSSESQTEYYFKCKNNHSFKLEPYKVFQNKNSGCPYCSSQKICLDNCLATTYPEIVKEWHATKNGVITPHDITYGSGKIIWWQCQKCGHEWPAETKSRCKKGCGCPKCNESKLEKRVANWFDKENIEYIQEYKPGIKHKRLLRYDFFLPYYNIYIECHGEQHYNTRFYIAITKSTTKGIISFLKTQLRDKIKEQYCKDNNLPLLIIPYTELNNIEQILETFINGLK